jgi:hypothetical protein
MNEVNFDRVTGNQIIVLARARRARDRSKFRVGQLAIIAKAGTDTLTAD